MKKSNGNSNSSSNDTNNTTTATKVIIARIIKTALVSIRIFFVLMNKW